MFESFRGWLPTSGRADADRVLRVLDTSRGRAVFEQLAAPADESWYAPSLKERVSVEFHRTERGVTRHRVQVGKRSWHQLLTGAWAGEEPPAKVLAALRARPAIAQALGLGGAGVAVPQVPRVHAELAQQLQETVPPWLAAGGRPVQFKGVTPTAHGTLVSWEDASGDTFDVFLQSDGPRASSARGRYKIKGKAPIVAPLMYGAGIAPEALFPMDWLSGLQRAVLDLTYSSMERMVVSCPTTRGSVDVEGYPASAAAYEVAILTDAVREESAAWHTVAEKAAKALRKHDVVLGAMLGCGSYACAYRVQGQPKLVAKFSGDPADAASWKHVLSKVKGGRWPRGLIRTHCVEAFDIGVPIETVTARGRKRQTSPNRKFFLFTQELAGGLTSAEKAFFDTDAVTSVILGAAGIQGSGSLARVIGLAFFHDIPWEAVRDLLDTIRWLKVRGIRWHDLHGGNVMAVGTGEDRRYVIVDLGAAEAPRVKVPLLRG